jgi:hypothetical protein
MHCRVPATYVSVLTRAHLRSLAQLPREELLFLKRTIGELGVIGRNLYQIARAANQGERGPSPPEVVTERFGQSTDIPTWPMDGRWGNEDRTFADLCGGACCCWLSRPSAEAKIAIARPPASRRQLLSWLLRSC